MAQPIEQNFNIPPRNAQVEFRAPVQNFSRQNDNFAAGRNNFNAPQQNEQHGENIRSSFLRRLRLIPKFNGESFQDLKDFIDITETLHFLCTSSAEDRELLDLARITH